MYAQCPHCQTLFRVSSSQLTAADARVRCGQCFTVFNALDHLRVLSEEEERSLAAGQQAPQASGDDDRDSDEETIPHVLEHDLDNLKTPVVRVPRYSRRTTSLFFLGSLALLMLLAVQIIVLERVRLIRYPELRPLILSLCDSVNCTLPQLHDTEQIDLLSRQLYTHPNVAGALMIRASMVNNAPFPQPYPLLELSLSDEQGHVVAMRRFKPTEYLAEGEDPQAMMTPGSPVAINLEIADPGENALAYEFSFL
jgi:predicted Zn finger-like uncharacterized protein